MVRLVLGQVVVRTAHLKHKNVLGKCILSRSLTLMGSRFSMSFDEAVELIR